MAFGINKLLEVYVRQETTFGDTLTDPDFSSGVLLRPLENVDLGQITREALGDTSVRRSFSDAGLPALGGRTQAKATLKIRLSGATRDGGVVQSDGLSSFLDMVAGERHAPGNDLVETGSTVSVVNATGHSYVVGDVVLINGHARLVIAVETDSFTIAPKLPAAPSANDAIVGCESYFLEPGTAQPSVGVGLSRVGDSEWQFALGGCAATSLKLGEIAPGAQPSLEVEFSAAEHVRGPLTPATSETPERSVVVGVDGSTYIALHDATGAYWSPVLGSASLALGTGNLLVDGLSTSAVGGKVAVVPDLVTEEIGTVKILQDPAEGTTDKIDALVGQKFPLIVQIGQMSGAIVGVVYKEATFTKFPAPTGDDVKTLEFGIRASAGVLFRG